MAAMLEHTAMREGASPAMGSGSEKTPIGNGRSASDLGSRVWRALAVLGPGLVTGASDDDPSSRSSACRQYLQSGADIGGMGAAAQLLLPAGTWIYILLFGIASLLLQIVVPYSSYVKYLKWLTLSLFAYVATAFFVRVSWYDVLRATVLPQLLWSKDYLTGLIAVLGTTISPYLFFWQASQGVEEVKNNHGEKPLKRAPRQAPAHLGRIRKDTYFGMALSNIVAFFIILTTGVTLHADGQTDIATAAQAAQALAPLAGRWAAGLFVCGIIGTGLLVIPVLAGSAGYAMGESFKWPVSLEKKPKQAPGFYVTIAAATLAGVGSNFLHIDPIRALFWAAVLNGLVQFYLQEPLMSQASVEKRRLH